VVRQQVEQELADRTRAKTSEETIRLISAIGQAADSVRLESSKYSSVEDWQSAASTKAALLSAGVVALPLAGAILSTTFVDALRMAVRVGWGVGYVVARVQGVARLVEEGEDAVAFLAHWNRSLTSQDLRSSRVQPVSDGFVLRDGSALHRNFASAVVSLKLGSFVDITDVIERVNRGMPGAVPEGLRLMIDDIHEKLLSRQVGRAAVGLIPLVGSLVRGGLEFYVSRAVGEAAKRYYQAKALHFAAVNDR
jgi:hypothetical protein